MKLTEGKMRGQKKPAPKTRPIYGPPALSPLTDLIAKLEEELERLEYLIAKLEEELERLEDFEFKEGQVHIGPLWNAGYMDGLRDAVNCVRHVLNGGTRDE